jgi:Protein of unknown function (DUF3040)
MSLSRNEQRLLAEIERRLAAEEPGLADDLTNMRRTFIRLRRGNRTGERRPTAQLTRKHRDAKFERLSKRWNETPAWIRGTSGVLGVLAGLIAATVTFVHHVMEPGWLYMLWCVVYSLTFYVGFFGTLYSIDWAIKTKKKRERFWWVGIILSVYFLVGTSFMVALIALLS